jgi:ParB family chromosome partitioning protein
MSATLASVVKARREALGLSQRQLPGLDSALVSRIESGKVKDPAGSTLQALSKALGVTLEELNGAPASAVRMVELRSLCPDPNNPRTLIDARPEDLALVDSIKELGLLQPLAVRRPPDNAEGDADWMVVDGHRRYAALVLLHGPKSKTTVPVLVREGDGTQTLLMQLVANVQRVDMNPMDLAAAVAQLVDQKMDTQAIANAIGRKRRWVQEQASVGRHLTADAKDALREGIISISQAVALAAERNEKQQRDLLARVGLQDLNEDEIRSIVADTKAKTASVEISKQLDIEEVAGSGEAVKWLTPDVNGGFNRQEPTRVLRWMHVYRGEFEIGLFQFGLESWCANYRLSWRTTSVGGGSSLGGGRREDHRSGSAFRSFLDAAEAHYPSMCSRAMAWPEDRPAMVKLFDWILQEARGLGAPEALIGEFTRRVQPPAKPSAKPTPATPATASTKKQPKQPTLEELQQVPDWARPIARFPFVVVTSKATLCHGWARMVEVLAREIERDDGYFDRVLAAIADRDRWASSPDGTPYDWGSLVYSCSATFGPVT